MDSPFPAWAIVLALAWVPTAQPLTQDDVNAMGQKLSVKYSVISNIIKDDSYTFSVTLENMDNDPVGGLDWEIYFCNIHMLFPDQNLRDSRSIEVSRGINVTHVNGCLFKMFPAAGPVFFERNKPLVLSMVAANWMVANSDIMPNWYVAADGRRPSVIADTAEGTTFASLFDDPAKWKRLSYDAYNPITPDERYGYYESTANSASSPRPVPMPRHFTSSSTPSDSGLIKLDGTWILKNGQDLMEQQFPMTIRFLRGNFDIAPENTSASCMNVVCVQFIANSTLPEDGYKLALLPALSTIQVHAKGDGGALAASKTLYQLKAMKGSFSSLSIEDSPRYSYRIMTMDIARHFQSKETIMRYIDAISLYKLNYFHLRLADDEGWRLEIDDLAELTEVGGRSCYDPTESSCILPQFGAPPYGEALFLTKQDYKDLVQFAAERNVQIVPEFDMPGHSRAAIKAMEARYRNLGNSSAAAEYLLSDLDDKSVYTSVQLYTDNAMNPCLESTYRFVEKVVRTLQRYHREAGQELKLIHLGGDEVPDGAWINSSLCRPLIDNLEHANASAYASLKKYFIRSVYNITNQAGLGLGMWEDGFMEKDVPYPLDVMTAGISEDKVQPLYAFVWQNVWEWGAAKRAYLLANAGYKVILAPATHFYFDHPQEPDPEERGFYWATRFTGANKTFGFLSGDIYANMNHDFGRFGKPLSRKTLCPADKPLECPPLNEDAAPNVIGIEGTLFCETCHTESNVQGLAFPRVLVLAERAWYTAPWESIKNDTSTEFYASRTADWASFSSSVGLNQLPLLDLRNIQYHMNPPGVKEMNGVWLANCEFPGQVIEYSTDEGVHWQRYDRGSPPVSKPGFALFSTVVPGSRKRRSRTVKVISSATNTPPSHAAAIRASLPLLFFVSLLADQMR